MPSFWTKLIHARPFFDWQVTDIHNIFMIDKCQESSLALIVFHDSLGQTSLRMNRSISPRAQSDSDSAYFFSKYLTVPFQMFLRSLCHCDKSIRSLNSVVFWMITMHNRDLSYFVRKLRIFCTHRSSILRNHLGDKPRKPRISGHDALKWDDCSLCQES